MRDGARHCRRRLRPRRVAVLVLCSQLSGLTAIGRNSGTDLPTETLTLRDGTRLEGLIDSESESSIDFVQLVRPAGRPMHLVVRPFEREAIAEITRLPAADRDSLAAEISSFRARARIEAGQVRRIPLDEDRSTDPPGYRFRGRWFDLHSTIGEGNTRRVVVRLEQLFRAFRQVLPARGKQASKTLQIRLFGRSGEYAEFLRAERIELAHMAFYDITQHRIVAGSDLGQLADDVRRTSSQHHAGLAMIKTRERELGQLLKQRVREWSEAGYSQAECEALRTTVVKRWRKEAEAHRRQIRTAERRNRETLDRALDRLFARLHHEALHAYLEGQLYHGAEFDIPRWLNEGLAQVFESAILEAGRLRIDAPSGELLERIQADFRTADPLPLRDVLIADQAAFLIPHREDPASSQRHYLYAWGLAYYLLFEQQGGLSERLDQLVSRTGTADERLARFSTSTGEPVEQFEARWRAALLELESR